MMKFLEKLTCPDTPKGILLEKVIVESKIGESFPFNSSIIIVSTNVETPIDCHSERECWIISAGNAELNCNGQKIFLKTNDVIYFSPYDKHTVINNSQSELSVT